MKLECNLISDLKKMIKLELEKKHIQYDSNDIILSYLEYYSKLISQKKREVVFPDNFVLKNENLRKNFNVLIDKIKNGDDLTPYLSYKIKNTVDPKNKDMMLNAFNIHHLHIGNFSEKENKVNRTDELLHVIFNKNTAYVLEIITHTEYKRKQKYWCADKFELIRKLYPFLLKEIFPNCTTLKIINNDNLKKKNNDILYNHKTTLETIDNTTYFSIVSSNGSSTFIVNLRNELVRYLYDKEEALKNIFNTYNFTQFDEEPLKITILNLNFNNFISDKSNFLTIGNRDKNIEITF